MTKEFAAELGSRMATEGFSQRRLGEVSGVDHSSISRLLRGDRNATHEVAMGLMAGLHVNPGQSARFLLLAAGHSSEDIQAVLQVPQEAVAPTPARPLPRALRRG